MRKVAITGGIASGKSTVCQILKELGAFVISADDIVHTLLSQKTPLGQQIEKLLGSDVIEEGTFSRKKIAERVFRDHKLLKRLEELLHPEVQRLIEEKYNQVSPKTPLFVVEVPLLFESRLNAWYELKIVILADEKRCRERSSLDEEEFTRRTKRLMSQQEKAKRADFTIENNGSLEELKTSVTQLYTKIT